MPAINVLEIFKTSFTLVILLFCSIVTLTFAVERWWYYRAISVNAEAFMNGLKQLLDANKFAEALKLCGATPGPVSALMQAAVTHRSKSKSEVAALLSAAQIDERSKLEHYLGILGTMGNTAPFIGLFGTVVGILIAFERIGTTGSTNLAVVGPGISEALIATAMGLFAAIPAVLSYNHFTHRVKEFAATMDDFALEFLNIAERNFT